MTLAPELTAQKQNELDQLGVRNTQRLRRELTDKERSFLTYHRKYVFAQK